MPRCAICHGDVAGGPLLCPACQTVVHAECRVGLPRPTLGCPHGSRGSVRERVIGAPYELRPCGGGVLFVSHGPHGAPGGGDDLSSAVREP